MCVANCTSSPARTRPSRSSTSLKAPTKACLSGNWPTSGSAARRGRPGLISILDAKTKLWPFPMGAFACELRRVRKQLKAEILNLKFEILNFKSAGTVLLSSPDERPGSCPPGHNFCSPPPRDILPGAEAEPSRHLADV